MKHKFLFVLVFTVLAAFSLVLVFGCISITHKDSSTDQTPTTQTDQTQPPPETPPQPALSLSPFTVGILNRLQNEAHGFTIDKCQFFLSGGITLERDNDEENQWVENGIVVFVDNNNRKEIKINDKTEGKALRMIGNELYLCFDQEDEYQLPFYAAGGENSQYVLKFTPQRDPLNDARGSVEYGGKKYLLKFNGGIPHLMIELTEKKDMVNHRSDASGRKINSARASEPPVPLTTEILNRMKKSADFSIDQFQLFLSGEILLERFADQKTVNVVNGIVVFEDNPISWYITIRNRTEGLAVRITENRDETNLYLCFDQDNRNQLIFSSSGNDPLFYLKSNPLNDPLSDARGSVEYGG